MNFYTKRVVASLLAEGIFCAGIVASSQTVVVRRSSPRVETIYVHDYAEKYISRREILNDIPAWEEGRAP